MPHIASISRIIANEHAAAEIAARTGQPIARCQQLQADRANDAAIDAWKARRREAARRTLCARLADERRAAAIKCANDYATKYHN